MLHFGTPPRDALMDSIRPVMRSGYPNAPQESEVAEQSNQDDERNRNAKDQQ
jgi:hypothetical protein